MTNQRSIYILKDNTVRELPMMEKPVLYDDFCRVLKDAKDEGLCMDLYSIFGEKITDTCNKYHSEIKSLRTIACHPSCVDIWKDSQELIEGVDYDISETNNHALCFPPYDDPSFMCYPIYDDHIVEPNEMVSGKEVGEEFKAMMSEVEEDAAHRAAVFLEELHISGDTMVNMDHSLDDVPEEEQGAYYLHDILAIWEQKVLKNIKS